MENTLKKNLEYAEKVRQQQTNAELSPLLVDALKISSNKNLLDLGCGEGNNLNEIKNNYPKLKLTGVDLSPKRVEISKKRIPSATILQGDILNIELKEKYDLIISTQVIEHLNNPEKLVNKIKNNLKKEGHVYVNSVIKKPWAIYKYRNNNKFVLDPTHVSEFKNLNHFTKTFTKQGFEIVKTNIFPVKRKIKNIEIRIPGFYIVEGIFKLS